MVQAVERTVGLFGCGRADLQEFCSVFEHGPAMLAHAPDSVMNTRNDQGGHHMV